jgi:predicted membrane protein
LSDAGKDFIFNIAQITAGFLVALLLYRVLKGRFKSGSSGIFKEMALIAALVLIAVFLPLDTYGILPIIAAMAAAGFKPNRWVAFFTANAFFN